MNSMKKRIALVTGGTRGLGLEWCKQLQDHGYIVFMGGRNSDQIEKAAKTLRDQGYKNFNPIILDILNLTDIEGAYNIVQDTVGQLNLLINNAAVNANTPDFSDDKTYELKKLEIEPLTKMFQINALAPLLLVQKFVPIMTPLDALIVNVSSEEGSIFQKQEPYNFGYAGSKAALNMFTKILAQALKDKGINVISLHPGWARTEIGGNQAPSSPHEVISKAIEMISGVSQKDSGKFLDGSGFELSW